MNIKLMPDYGCWVTWVLNDEGIYENVNPNELEISDNLLDRINEWALKYDKTYNQSVGQDSGFKTKEELIEFDKEGKLLWKKMINELGDDNEILYHSILDHRVLKRSDL